VSSASADSGVASYRPIDAAAIRVLLLDADGNLFPSEEPAFDASVTVLDRLMQELGSDRRHDPQELRRATTGRNFRATAAELAGQWGRPLSAEELDRWVAEENAVVSRHLAAELAPDDEVVQTLTRLSRRFALAVVSSSALSRLDACFTATGLGELLPAGRRFSAEDSLSVPTSKPSPAVYQHAGSRLGIAAAEGLAVEDSVPGATSAIAAGFATVGNVRFVAPNERERRVEELRAAGVHAVISSWGELEALLGEPA
jgi:HAD superfamily hydrolase (TIGR01509 family)